MKKPNHLNISLHTWKVCWFHRISQLCSDHQNHLIPLFCNIVYYQLKNSALEIPCLPHIWQSRPSLSIHSLNYPIMAPTWLISQIQFKLLIKRFSHCLPPFKYNFHCTSSFYFKIILMLFQLSYDIYQSG